jgi:hypothetical protein
MAIAMNKKVGVILMFLHSKSLYQLLIGFIAIIAMSSYAEPYIAVKNNMPCAACHVNPIGGGARNNYGSFYGTHTLPQTAGSQALFDSAKISDSFRLGANLRANYYQSDRDSTTGSSATDQQTEQETTRTFETQSAQIYMVLQPKDSRFSLYIDEQVAPGGALNREAFVLAQLGKSHYLKMGRMLLPYGIRIEDDTAFIRQATGFNFDAGDNGVELGLQYGKTLINLVASNGSSNATNDDNRMQLIARVEYLGSQWRVGGTALVNDAKLGERTQTNLFAGFNLLGFVFLAETDYIVDESIAGVFSEFQEQRVYFFEVNRELTKGLNLKITTEYLDPDTYIAENHRTRNSLLVEYTPYANIQFRAGLRDGEDIPQRATGNFLDVFAQVHLYF